MMAGINSGRTALQLVRAESRTGSKETIIVRNWRSHSMLFLKTEMGYGSG
jgi:hypothetical protein